MAVARNSSGRRKSLASVVQLRLNQMCVALFFFFEAPVVLMEAMRSPFVIDA